MNELEVFFWLSQPQSTLGATHQRRDSYANGDIREYFTTCGTETNRRLSSAYLAARRHRGEPRQRSADLGLERRGVCCGRQEQGWVLQDFHQRQGPEGEIPRPSLRIQAERKQNEGVDASFRILPL